LVVTHPPSAVVKTTAVAAVDWELIVGQLKNEINTLKEKNKELENTKQKLAGLVHQCRQQHDKLSSGGPTKSKVSQCIYTILTIF